MKHLKNHPHILGYTLTALFALSLGIALPLLTAGNRLDPTRESVTTEVPYCVTSPTVPEQITFADQKIDLQRYDYRERMDRELMAYTYMHSTTMLIIKRANRYFPLIEPILREQGLPDDIKYLAVIESSLNPLAKSPAGAAGMWQFMPTTAREYKLEVNDEVDERYHIEKETVAACRYLKQAYNQYGNWLCVAASYNAGLRRITSQLKAQMVEQAADLWLTEETSRYMFRLLAAKSVIEQPQRYGFLLKREQLYPPIPCTTDTVKGSIDTLAAYARRHDITYAQLKSANPWLRTTRLSNRLRKQYVLRIPLRKALHYDPAQTPVHHRAWVVD